MQSNMRAPSGSARSNSSYRAQKANATRNPMWRNGTSHDQQKTDFRQTTNWILSTISLTFLFTFFFVPFSSFLYIFFRFAFVLFGSLSHVTFSVRYRSGVVRICVWKCECTGITLTAEWLLLWFSNDRTNEGTNECASKGVTMRPWPARVYTHNVYLVNPFDILCALLFLCFLTCAVVLLHRSAHFLYIFLCVWVHAFVFSISVSVGRCYIFHTSNNENWPLAIENSKSSMVALTNCVTTAER